MKTKLFLTLLLSLVFYLLSSQIPQGFNYQAVLRDDPSNNPIISEGVQIRFTIQTAGAVVVYQETHSTATDEFGAISLVVGGGTPVGAYVFSDIDWSVPLSLKTEFEYPVSGTPDYDKLMGTTALKAVPYAMMADAITQPVDKMGIMGTTTNDEEAIFEVKNKDGQIVFAVYNEGVRIYVNDIDDVKGPKGGFAIGGFGSSIKTIPHQYLFVSGDSVRINIDNGDADKGPKGGFAIGGFGTVKGPLTQKYFMVSNDSVRIYIDNADSDKGPKGGFAIGGYGIAKGKPQDLLVVNNDSVRIYIDNLGDDKGPKGGFAIGGYGLTKAAKQKYLSVQTTSTNIQVTDTLKGFSVTNIQGGASSNFMKIDKINSFIGHETGVATTPSTTGEGGKYNVFLGYQSGNKNKTGYKNVFLGYRAGISNLSAEHNIFIGTHSGALNETGRYNTFLGSQAGLSTNASENTFVGYSAGILNETGQYNTFLGTNSGAFHTSGDYNTFLGWGSGNNNSGARNVFVGASAGSSNTGSGNVYIGYNANLSGSNRLLVNGGTGTTLIYGEFDNKLVTIYDVLKLNPRASEPTTPSPAEGTLYVNSTNHHIYCYLNGTWKQLDN